MIKVKPKYDIDVDGYISISSFYGQYFEWLKENKIIRFRYKKVVKDEKVDWDNDLLEWPGVYCIFRFAEYLKFLLRWTE